MSLWRQLWLAAGRRGPLGCPSPCSLLLQACGGRAPSIACCWVQPLFTGRALAQVREQKPRASLQAKSEQGPPLTAAQKVKRAGVDVTSLIVVLIGAGITGGLLYVVFSELFSPSSPNKVYGSAFEKCRNHPELIAALGEPIKAFGETTKRGRRQHIVSISYFKNDVKCMRLKFYISGSESRLKGVVHVDVKENPEHKFEFQFIIVELDTIPRRTVIVEDNRYMNSENAFSHE